MAVLKAILLSSALLACAYAQATAPPVINITASSGYALNGENFTFACNSTEKFSNLTVIVNGTSMANSSRLSNITNLANTMVTFTYASVTPEDNGTMFTCVNSTSQSTTLVMDVAFILFVQSNVSNSSLWVEFMNNTDFVVNCSANAYPPDNVKVTPSNMTSNFANVKYNSYDDTSGGFTFTAGVVENAGNYTCTASNELVTDSLTYQVFVGGPPDTAAITDVSFMYDDVDIGYLSFMFTDTSNAPARGVYVTISGLETSMFVFSSPSGSRSISHQVGVRRNDTVPMDYAVTFTPFNTLGNGTVASDMVFIAGTDFSVNITTSNVNVSETTNFTITCTATSSGVDLELVVNGLNSTIFPNVIIVEKTNMSTTFVYRSVAPSDNGTVFTCIGSVEDTDITSNEITINVLYAPRFQDYNNATNWLEFPISSSFNFNCSLNSTGNPPLTTNISYVNTTTDFSNVNVTLSNTSLVYTVINATINNRVNLTCVANSSFAVTTANYLAFVGGAPNNVSAMPKVYVEGGMVYIDLTVIDESNAPAKNYILTIENFYLETVVPNVPTVNQNYPRLLNKSLTFFGSDEYTLYIIASNSIGSTVVYNQTLDIPVLSSSSVPPTQPSTGTPSPSQSTTPSPAGSNAGAIAAGIIIPVIVLILIGFAAGTVFYFYRNRKRKTDFSRLDTYAHEDQEASLSGYGATKTT